MIRIEKNTHAAVNKKRKTEKKWTFFITGCLIKPFKITIIFFYFASLFAAQFPLFVIRRRQKISKGEIENGK